MRSEQTDPREDLKEKCDAVICLEGTGTAANFGSPTKKEKGRLLTRSPSLLIQRRKPVKAVLRRAGIQVPSVQKRQREQAGDLQRRLMGSSAIPPPTRMKHTPRFMSSQYQTPFLFHPPKKFRE